MRKCIRVIFLLFGFAALAQPKNSKLIDSLLKADYKQLLPVTKDLKKYKIQIIYTEINRDKDNAASFKHHYYNYDSTNYFYCASMVKLPCSVLALEKINELNSKGIDASTTMLTDAASPCQKKVHTDETAANGLPSVAQYIRRMLLVSDNLAFGRIYEFLTPDYLHAKLKKYGFQDMRIVHRFDGGCKGIQNLTCNPIRFVDKDGKLLYSQSESVAKGKYNFPYSNALVGKAYIDAGGKKVSQPKDFSSYNYMSLFDVHRILQRIVFHEQINEGSRFKITHNDWEFLMKYLSMYPRQSDYPAYDTLKFNDSYKKYFMYGDSKEPIKDSSVRIYNIVGQSYGFMADCAYVVDLKSKTEFMLSAVVYANEKEIINTGSYEYKTVALPFLSKLGQLFYQYEQGRKRQFVPNFANLEAIDKDQ